MDREYLLRRHDEELARSRNAATEVARLAHEGLAQAFKDAAEKLEPPTVVQFRSVQRPAA